MRAPRPRCGMWMPRAGAYCGDAAGHTGACRTAAAARARIRRAARYNRRRAGERGAEIDAYKLERGCERCGYREAAVALDLDHVDPVAKVDDVSRLMRYAPWPEVLAELAKCRVLCANCHRVKTHRDGDFNRRKS